MKSWKWMIGALGLATLAGACGGMAPGGELGLEGKEDSWRRGAYFRVRVDMRRCVAPLCGGYWVSLANNDQINCPVGGRAEACYVSRIDWQGPRPVENVSLVYGTMGVERTDFGRLAFFKATAGFVSLGVSSSGSDFGITNNGLVCFTSPCNSWDAELLNGRAGDQLSGIELKLSEEESTRFWEAAAAGPVVVTGELTTRVYQGGVGRVVTGTQAFVPAHREVSAAE